MIENAQQQAPVAAVYFSNRPQLGLECPESGGRVGDM